MRCITLHVKLGIVCLESEKNVTVVWYQVSISGQRLRDPCFSTVSKKQGQMLLDQFQQVFLTLLRRVIESYRRVTELYSS